MPYGIDPLNIDQQKSTGVFFMDSYDFIRCFDGFSQARNRGTEGYKNSWYDVDDDSLNWGTSIGKMTELEFAPKEIDGLLFISIESYYYDMVPLNCYWTKSIAEQPTATYKIYQNNILIDS